MQIRQGNTLQALRGVQAFLDAHAGVLGGVATSGARKRLDAQVETLNVHVLMQSGSTLASQGATKKQYALRHALIYDHMAPIARIAAADLPQTPELSPLRMPRSVASTEMLHAAAVGMANAAEPYAAVFIAAGLGEDFLVQLRAAAGAMLVPIDARTQSRSVRRGATEGLSESVRNARKIVRVLDAFVRRVLRNNPSLLASWDAVRRPPAKTGKVGRSGDGGAPKVVPPPPVPGGPGAAVAGVLPLSLDAAA